MYLTYPILQTVSAKLTWSHYIELLKIDNPFERSFYEKTCEKENCGVRELKRQMKSMLFHRIALSTDKEKVLKLASEGQIIEKTEDILKESFIVLVIRKTKKRKIFSEYYVRNILDISTSIDYLIQSDRKGIYEV